MASHAAGPTGASPYLHEDHQLVIYLTASNDAVDGDGVPAEAITGIDDVFTLTYTGDEHAHVWLEHDSADVEFYAGEDASNSLEGKANNVTLAPNESVNVGFTADSRGQETMDRLIDSVEINAKVPEEAADVEADRSVSPAPTAAPCPSPSVGVDAPKETTRAITVEDADPCQRASVDALDLEVGPQVTLEELDVAVAETGDVSLTVGPEYDRKSAPFLEPGTAAVGDFAVDGDGPIESVEYRFAVDEAWLEREGVDPDGIELYGHADGEWVERDLERTGAGDGTLEYAAIDGDLERYAVGVETARPTVEEVEANRTTVEPGESIAVSATVANRGADAPVDVALRVDGEPVDAESTTLEANGSTEVAFEHAVDDADASRVDVVAADARDWSDARVLEPVAGVDVSPTDADAPSDFDRDSGTDDPAERSDPAGSLETVALAVGAVLAAVALVARRRA